jgi:hypothetical protein
MVNLPVLKVLLIGEYLEITDCVMLLVHPTSKQGK